MSHLTLKAYVLHSIGRNAGAWVSVDRIAARLGASCDKVDALCAELLEQSQVQHREQEGTHLYGIGIHGDQA